MPILQRAGVGQIECRMLDRVLINPTNARGIRTQRRRNPVWKPFSSRVQILKYATARPIEVCAIFEDHIHEADTKKREAAHGT